MTRDYYRILGVRPEASPDEIKSAYRKGAMQLHPDQSGEDSQPFRELKEAYDVLGDSHLRSCYDGEHASTTGAHLATARQGPEPLRRRRCPVEPLIPNEQSGGYRREEPSWRSRDLWPEPLGADAEVHVQVELTRGQALRGGTFRLWLRIRRQCPNCRSQGHLLIFSCPTCAGSGAVDEQLPLDLSYGPGVVNGSVDRILLRHRQGQIMILFVHFWVSDW